MNTHNSHYENSGDDLAVLKLMNQYPEWILDLYEPHLGSPTAEVGVGQGAVLLRAAQRFKTIHFTGIEPAESQLEELITALHTLHISNISTVSGYLDDSNEVYDSIIYNNVLEHIEDDGLEIEKAYSKLKDGGKIITFSPAMPFLYSDFDKKIGHFRRYTKKEMEEKIKKAGFSIVGSKYVDFIGVFAWFVQMKVLKSTTFNPITLKVYDNAINRLQRMFDVSSLLPFGKNIFVVGQK